MVEVITESGMDFIADNAFPIEKSALYKKTGEGVKSVEFVRAIDDRLVFVEARSSFANPNNPSAENLAKYQKEVDDICNKFIHSLSLFSSVKVGVAEDALPDDFVLPPSVSLSFILVIKHHEQKWCNRIKTALLDVMPTYIKAIWKPTIFVINHETAIKYNLTM